MMLCVCVWRAARRYTSARYMLSRKIFFGAPFSASATLWESDALLLGLFPPYFYYFTFFGAASAASSVRGSVRRSV